MVNRKTAPISADIELPKLVNPAKEEISKNISLYYLEDKESPVIKLEIISKAGIYYEPKKVIAEFAAKMLRGGTKTRTSTTIESDIDYYGAVLHNTVRRDIMQMSLLCLKKHFNKLLDILEDIISNSAYPESYLELQKDLVEDGIRLSNSKNSVYAHKILKKRVYGANHPYGKILEIEDLKSININDLKKYYHDMLFSNLDVYLCGNIGNGEINILKNNLKGITSNDVNTNKYKYKENQINTHTEVIKRQNTIQDTIVIGSKFPIRSHEDYLGLIILNELFGGFFGSRLMSNIREKLGYTYGIHSRIISMIHSSLFVITSDVTLNNGGTVLEKIHDEIKKLQNEPAPAAELSTLKQYMKGTLLLSLDGTIAKMDNFINMNIHNLDYDYFKKLYNLINDISAKNIQELAQKYLTYDDFCKVIITDNK